MDRDGARSDQDEASELSSAHLTITKGVTGLTRVITPLIKQKQPSPAITPSITGVTEGNMRVTGCITPVTRPVITTMSRVWKKREKT